MAIIDTTCGIAENIAPKLAELGQHASSMFEALNIAAGNAVKVYNSIGANVGSYIDVYLGHLPALLGTTPEPPTPTPTTIPPSVSPEFPWADLVIGGAAIGGTVFLIGRALTGLISNNNNSKGGSSGIDGAAKGPIIDHQPRRAVPPIKASKGPVVPSDLEPGTNKAKRHPGAK